MPRKHVKIVGALLGGLASLATSVARGDDVDQATQKLIHLDQRVHIMALEFNEAPREQPDLPDRQLIDAQGLLGLGRTDEATTLLLGVIARWPHAPAAHDAAFLLGDALFSLRDFLSARRYFEEATAHFTGTKREQRALGRLVEIALRTGDFEHCDRYLALLARVGDAAPDPSVAYVRGKLLYYRDNLDAATTIFASIAPTSTYGWRARYLMGAIFIKRGDLAGATGAYEGLLQTAAPDDDAREIQDLARLALGRLSYQQGQLGRAAAYYEGLPPRSKAQADGLYELGWTYVRAKDFEKARGAFARLLLLQPDGPQAPEVKLLLANLHLRRGDLPAAQVAFSAERDELEPTYKKLHAVLARSQADPAFFETLTRKDLDQVDLVAFVPASARNWVRADPEIERLLTLAADVMGTQRAVVDAASTLAGIEHVLTYADRMTMFPDLRRVRQGSTEVLGALVEVRRQFAERARRLEQPYLGQAEARSLDGSAAERASIERQLGAQLAFDAPSARDAPGSTTMLQKSPEPAGELRAAVLLLEGPQGGDRVGSADTQRAAAPAVVSGAREHAVAERLQQVLQQEHQLQNEVGKRVSPKLRTEIERALEVVSRADAALGQLLTLDARLDAEAEVRVAALQAVASDRRLDVAAAEGKLAVVVGDAQSLGGSLARVMYTRIADRLYDLVVRADVGLIDVAWAVKDRRSVALQALLKKKNLEEDEISRELQRQHTALSARFAAETAWARRLPPATVPDGH